MRSDSYGLTPSACILTCFTDLAPIELNIFPRKETEAY